LPQRIAIGLLIGLFLYLGLFTWNIRTGYVDTLASHTGLEFARWMLAPGKWVHVQATSFLNRYLYFVGIRQENDLLRQELDAAKVELSNLREDATEVERLRRLLSISPPQEWTRQGARVVSQRLGPNAALETLLIDKGSASGVNINTPVVVPAGVVGRVLRLSPNAATVLLVTDSNSHIPVVSQTNRTQGILKGLGPDHDLTMQYVPQGAPVEEGEILVTSGLADIFPKGLPVAKVTKIGRSGSSLFQVIDAAPLFAPRQLEEVALLFRGPVAASRNAAAGAAPAADAAGPAAVGPIVKPAKGHAKTGQPAPSGVSPAPAPAPAPAATTAHPASPAAGIGPGAPAGPHQDVPEGTDVKRHRKSIRTAPR